MASSSADRLRDELNAVGCLCNRIVEDYVVIESGNPTIISAVQSLHISDYSTWLSTDLDVHAASLEALVSPSQWDDYRAVQTNEIRRLRHEAYEALNDAMSIIERFAEADNFGQLLVAMTDLRDGVEAEYPFPGDY